MHEMILFESEKSRLDESKTTKNTFESYCTFIGDTAFLSHIKMLAEKLTELNIPQKEALHCQIQLSTSCYSAGCPLLKLLSQGAGPEVLLSVTPSRISQRLVACQQNTTKNCWQDFVFLKYESGWEIETTKAIPKWFAEVLLFIRHFGPKNRCRWFLL